MSGNRLAHPSPVPADREPVDGHGLERDRYFPAARMLCRYSSWLSYILKILAINDHYVSSHVASKDLAYFSPALYT